MSQEDRITPINVGGFVVGIIGLQAALEEAAREGLPTDESAGRRLLERLKAKNYIPPKSEADHARAFLHAYRRHTGEPVEADVPEGLSVEVLGPGCPSCERLTEMVRNVMASATIAGRLEHVRDLNQISRYGLVATPALVINGELKAAGRLPREKQILEWLQRAAKR